MVRSRRPAPCDPCRLPGRGDRGDLAPGRRGQVSAAELAAARGDLSRLDIGWALVWPAASPAVTGYLTATGFRLDYQADGVTVYRLAR